jgi:ubiquinone/menaquinone biosynthesis C-methylase UbiE
LAKFDVKKHWWVVIIVVAVVGISAGLITNAWMPGNLIVGVFLALGLTVLLLVAVFLVSRNNTFRKYWQILVGGIATFEPVKLEVKDFESDGLILDIGGGGEGIIGRLKGKQAVAIDIRKDELDEILAGPQKVVMDARQLAFPGSSFHTATAFFSMMYLKTRGDHQQVISEAWRVLKPGAHLHLWDVDLSKRPGRRKEFYLVRLRYRVGEFENSTGYGMRWPEEPRGEEYYLQLASQAGFQHLTTAREKHIFYLMFIKQ